MPGVDPPAPFHPLATRRVRETVRVGVGVIVVANNTTNGEDESVEDEDTRSKTPSCCKIYAGLRKGSHGAGTLALPGGHLELFETWEDCARREVREEMNVELADLQFAHVTNDVMEMEGKHYVTIFMMGRIVKKIENDGIPQNMEPEKCAGWESYTWQELQEYSKNDHGEGPPDELFGPLRRLLQDSPPSVLEYLSKSSPSNNNVVE
jgi:8-oxo-dGTP diphosphatase